MSKQRPLTERQQEIYDLIETACHTGMPPTIRELMAATGINSPNGISCHLRSLKKKGRIEIDETKSRGIRLVATDVSVRKEGGLVFVSTSGPVAFTVEEWKRWAKNQSR